MDQEILKKVAGYLPNGLRSVARKAYYLNRHWAHPALKKFGTVQDLYYWVADGNLDTLLLLQNYFSALYPALNSETDGTVSLYDKDGEALGIRPFALAHHGSAKLRVSSLLRELGAPTDDTFGTLEVRIAIPTDVLAHLQDQTSIYFWDRFYIGYSTSLGQTCFVHGIDKTHIYQEGKSARAGWYKNTKGHQWAPEIPVNIEDYQRFSVIMVNRTSRRTTATLTLSDTNDGSLSWSEDIPPKGVRRFQLNPEATAGLAPVELRMRVEGMSTQFGRPVVFKEFPNGAISAMHC